MPETSPQPPRLLRSTGARIARRLVGPLILLLAVAFILLRLPRLWLQPRFWAEEGTIYFAHACAAPLGTALIAPQLGYYSLFDNLGAWLVSRLLPLDQAPLGTTSLSVLGPISVLALLMINRHPALRSPLAKIVATLFVLAGGFNEMWLNLIHVQFYFAVATALILLDEDAPPGIRGWLYPGLLLLFGLTGIVSLLLLPAFLLRVVRAGVRARRLQLAALAIAASVQLAAFAWSLAQSAYSERFVWPGVGTVLRAIALNLAAPFGELSMARSSRIWVLVGCAAMALMAARPIRYRAELLIGIAVNSIASVLLSIGMLGGPRYCFLSLMLIVIGLLGVVADRRKPWRSSPLAFIAILLLGVALLRTVSEVRLYADHVDDPAWPRWQDEVAAWRLDHDYRLRVAPQWPEYAPSVRLAPACDRVPRR